MEDHGYQPLSKFSRARDSILHYLCLSEWSNGSTGNSVDWKAYAWRISNEPADVHIPNTEFSSIMDEWLEYNPEVTDSQELRDELVGHFMVIEYSGGHVSVAQYATEAELVADFQKIEADHDAWASAQEEDAPKYGDYFS